MRRRNDDIIYFMVISILSILFLFLSLKVFRNSFYVEPKRIYYTSIYVKSICIPLFTIQFDFGFGCAKKLSSLEIFGVHTWSMSTFFFALSGCSLYLFFIYHSYCNCNLTPKTKKIKINSLYILFQFLH